jgi:tetratricopeptide (TPR) repeat protein
MRTLSIALGLSLAISASPSAASVLVIQKSLAATCYESAAGKRHDWTAIQDCSSALDHEMMTRDDRAATLVNRGMLRMRSGKIDSATRDFDRALELAPTEPEVWLAKSISEFDAGNSAAALQLSDKAISLRTRRPAVAYYIRGLAKEINGDVEGAYADLVRARDLDPAWSDPAMQLTRYKVIRR